MENGKWDGQTRLSGSDGNRIKRGETEFPLVLAWTCTVHKVQDLSLTTAYFGFDLEKQNSFNEGQIYVALSRVSSTDNLISCWKLQI